MGDAPAWLKTSPETSAPAAAPRTAQPPRPLAGGAALKPLLEGGDHIADLVISSLERRMPRPRAATEEASGRIRRSTAPGPVGADAAAQIRRSLPGGRPLDGSTRGRLEGAMGADLGHVRLHGGPAAHDLASGVESHAFSVGSHVFLGESAEKSMGTRRGDAVLAHEATHTLQPGADTTVRRLALQPDEVLAAVSKISFVKKKLNESLKLEKSSVTGDNSLSQRDQGTETMRQHVTAAIAQYQNELAGADELRDQVMALTLVVDAVAQVLAVNVLNDPGLAPQVAGEFLKVYGKELKSKLKKADDLEKTLDLTSVITSDDPVRLYLHDELRIDYAARRVRSMAFAANMEPKAMLSMLRGRFEADMAARTKTGVGKQEDTKEAYRVSGATGEMTAAWFKDLFGDVEKAGWKDGKGGRQLDYTPATQKRLDDLESEVVKGPATVTKSTDRGLSWKQEQHLDEVDSADKTRNESKDTNGKSIDDLVGDAIAKLLGVKVDQAMQMVGKVRAGVSSLPLTISVQGEGWFGSMTKWNDSKTQKTKEDFDYKAGSSRKAETKNKDLFGKKGAKGSIKHYGEWKQGDLDKQDRTGNYNRFRGWKDQAMTGNRGMTSDELPSFAAVNPNWQAFGSEMPVNDPDNKFAQGTRGVNSYGDVHFMLNRGKIAKRCVYTATDHGEPHSDPFLAFADFLLADKSGSRTKLKDIKSVNKVALHVLNAIILGDQAKALSLSNQAFEVQIFGPLNMVDDVTEVWYSDSVSQKVVTNLGAYNKAFGKPIKPISSPSGVVVQYEGSVFGKHKKTFAQELVNAL